MAEEKLIQKKEHREQREQELDTLVRVFGYDLPGSKNIFAGLTRIKGVSWAISNAICNKFKLPKLKKVSELSKADIEKIESFLKELPIPDFLKNRRFDRETGETKHYYGSNIDIRKEFDIKRLKKIRSYKGIRHAAGLPVRGQKTRSHFRNKDQIVGVKRKKHNVKKI